MYSDMLRTSQSALKTHTQSHSKTKDLELSNCCVTANNKTVRCKNDILRIGYNFYLTWDNSSNKLEISRCLYTHKLLHTARKVCGDSYSISTDITGPELNNLTCSLYNRQGPQRRQCVDGYGPAVFSDSVTCADCSKHKHFWILNLVFQLTVVTIMYLVVILLQIKGTNSPYNIMMAYVQVAIARCQCSGDWHWYNIYI